MQQSLILVFLMGQCCLITCHLYVYHYIDEENTWFKARQYCRGKYTDLATVSNMMDMKRLHQLAHEKEAWIGLRNKTDVKKTWHWSLTGVEFNDSEAKWNKGEPNDVGNQENCVLMKKDFLWYDFPCKTRRRFLCYNESATKKFHLIEEEKTWFEAQIYCRQHHTDLVSGRHQLKDEELKSLVDNTGEDEVFIGLFRDTCRWSDGSSFSFRHWHPDVTDGVRNQPQCGVIMKDSRSWNSSNCSDQKPFFCYDDNMILIKEKMNWEDALYYCREHHRDLVSITNLDEQRWVQEKAKNATTPFVWTGLHYTCTLDFWFWVSDERVTYKNWASGQDWDDCDMSGAMETGGQHKWLKKKDDEKFNFICFKS